ncbi:hypothetical protein ACWEH1_33350 [Micromonospora chersina]|jgi:hypothetical protein|uniref:hypothetical protein n=1 Tax=Streptomyces sp. NPDC052013 TaxID=3365679 RepID=UPI0037D8AE82
MKTTNGDYLISLSNYILEHMRRNHLDLDKTIQTLGTVELDEHHKEDLQFANPKELIMGVADCLEHLRNYQYDNLKKKYAEELSAIDRFIEKYI